MKCFYWHPIEKEMGTQRHDVTYSKARGALGPTASLTL